MENNEKGRELVLGILEKGLEYIADYVVESSNCNFAVCAENGNVLYEKKAVAELSSESSTSKLVYTISTHEGPVVLMLTGLSSDKLEQGMNSMKQIEFAIQCYFSSANRQKKTDSTVQGGVVKYTIDQPLNRASFLNIVNTHCNPDFQYYVSILNDCTREEQRYMAKNLKRTQTFNISILNGKNLVLIVQHMYNPLTNTIDINSPSEEEQQGIFSNLIELYRGCPKFATGNSCYPTDLYLSYQQAMFTMSFMKLTGHKCFSQRYSELSIGIPLISNNWMSINAYCQKNIGALIESDETNNTSYFKTLTTYLDNSCNGKETADELYIHANTLYYRMKKIEGLLGCTTTSMCDITHLYYVTKVYKALHDSGILDGEE